MWPALSLFCVRAHRTHTHCVCSAKVHSDWLCVALWLCCCNYSLKWTIHAWPGDSSNICDRPYVGTATTTTQVSRIVVVMSALGQKIACGNAFTFELYAPLVCTWSVQSNRFEDNIKKNQEKRKTTTNDTQLFRSLSHCKNGPIMSGGFLFASVPLIKRHIKYVCDFAVLVAA